MSAIANPFGPFLGLAGVGNTGTIYIGQPDLDPKAYPQAVNWDAGMTVPASQPLAMLGGYVVNGGAVATAYTASPYSMRVEDQAGRLVFEKLRVSAGADSSPVTTTDASPWISVKDAPFNAVGDGVADDTAAIQAAIYAAVAAKRQSIYLPPGKYRTTSSLYLADPSFAANISSPITFGFSLNLFGDGLGNSEGFGSQLAPDDNSFTCLYVGPGQHMMAGNFRVRPTNILLANTAGVHVAGGAGGATKVLLHGIKCEFYDIGIQGGGNYGSLADSVTVDKCDMVYCRRGYSVDNTQTYAWTFRDCHASYCIQGIGSDTGRPISVFGGNMSAPGFTANPLDVTWIGNVVDHAYGNTHTFRFDVLWTDTNVYTKPQFATGKYFKALAYNSLKYGVVPLDLISFNTTTNVVTLEVNQFWCMENYGEVTLRTFNSLATEMAANLTQIDFGVLAEPYFGGGTKVWGYHLENPASVTCLATAKAGFGGQDGMLLEGGMHNWGEDQGGYFAGAPSLYRLQSVYPFLNAQDRSITLRHISFQGAYGLLFRASSGGEISITGPVGGGGNGQRLVNPQIQICDNDAPAYPSVDRYWSAVVKRGHFDPSPFFSMNDAGIGTVNSKWATGVLGPRPYLGYAPDPRYPETLTMAELVALDPTRSGPIATTRGTYRTPWGGRPIDITDAVATPFRVVGLWTGFSFGQAMTGAAVTYRGKSNVMHVNTASVLNDMIPGLHFTLPNPLGGTQNLAVQAVDGGLRQVHVVRLDIGETGLAGDKDTDYSYGTIGQAAHTFAVIA